MKKLRRILPILFVFVMSFAVAIATACSSCGDNVPKVLDSISLDTSAAKLGYFVGESYTSDGLKVVAHYTDSEAHPDESIAASAEGVSINSSTFNGQIVGSYTVSVTYTYGGVTKTAEYSTQVVTESGIKGMKLDISDAKTRFLTTEQFSSEGVRVYAVVETANGDVDVLITDTTAYVVSVDGYKAEVGTYGVTVWYFAPAADYSGNYEVDVIEPRAGVDVRLKAGTSDTYAVGANLSDYANMIEVRVPDEYGIVDESGAPLASDQYTVSLWNGTTQVTNASSLGAGTYQIVVTYQGHESFVLIYVGA